VYQTARHRARCLDCHRLHCRHGNDVRDGVRGDHDDDVRDDHDGAHHRVWLALVILSQCPYLAQSYQEHQNFWRHPFFSIQNHESFHFQQSAIPGSKPSYYQAVTEATALHGFRFFQNLLA
jgi:hypothetical protein